MHHQEETIANEIILRSAEEKDLPAIVDIFNEVVRTSAASFELKEFTVDGRREWFSHYGGRHPLFVAEAKATGQVVAYAGISAFRSKPAYNNTVENSVYIHKDWQRKKLGSLLLRHLITVSEQLGYHAIIAGLTEGNDGSERLHERFGFKKVARFEEIGYKFDKWHSVIFYQLTLKQNQTNKYAFAEH